jgi:hypothetical protein
MIYEMSYMSCVRIYEYNSFFFFKRQSLKMLNVMIIFITCLQVCGSLPIILRLICVKKYITDTFFGYGLRCNFYFSIIQIWILLAFCVVAFVPSKMLHKYVDSFIRKNSVLTSTRHYPFVYWCGERLRSSRIADRKMVVFFFFLSYFFFLIFTFIIQFVSTKNDRKF